jgi:hypothetical protein
MPIAKMGRFLFTPNGCIDYTPSASLNSAVRSR